jgi:hypothetical protein
MPNAKRQSIRVDLKSPSAAIAAGGNAAIAANLPDADRALYLRYVRALALLCECASYVDEPDYLDLIDVLLDDACANYPLVTRSDGMRREIAVNGVA